MFDTIIIGGGPAGLTAAIYAARRSLNTLLLTRDLGGQAAKTFDIENYPGIVHTTGIDLAQTMKAQAESFGAKILFEETKKLIPENVGFSVETTNNKYQTKTIIVAFGKQPRDLDVPGEEQFKGHGVSYCATCDAPFYRDKSVIVAGGGNSALDGAILTSKIAKQVYLIHNSRLTGDQNMINKISETPNIEIILEDKIVEIKGDSVVRSVVLESGKKLAVDGVLVEIGYVVDRTLVQDLLKINEKNQVIISNSQETSVPGIFAAGDLTITPYKQIVIAAAEGAKAALSAYEYIQKNSGKKGIAGDWQKLLKTKVN